MVMFNLGRYLKLLKGKHDPILKNLQKLYARARLQGYKGTIENLKKVRNNLYGE